jgi:hypothetical protein
VCCKEHARAAWKAREMEHKPLHSLCTTCAQVVAQAVSPRAGALDSDGVVEEVVHDGPCGPGMVSPGYVAMCESTLSLTMTPRPPAKVLGDV